MEQPPKRPDGEAVMFSGTDADWVADIQALADVGVSAVDVRLFSCGPNQSMEATTCAASAMECLPGFDFDHPPGSWIAPTEHDLKRP